MRVYYELDHNWTVSNAIEELHKIMSIPEKVIRHSYQNKHFGKIIYHRLNKDPHYDRRKI